MVSKIDKGPVLNKAYVLMVKVHSRLIRNIRQGIQTLTKNRRGQGMEGRMGRWLFHAGSLEMASVNKDIDFTRKYARSCAR